jgi:hypothetical protein
MTFLRPKTLCNHTTSHLYEKYVVERLLTTIAEIGMKHLLEIQVHDSTVYMW